MKTDHTTLALASAAGESMACVHVDLESVKRYWEDVDGKKIILTVKCILNALSKLKRHNRVHIAILDKDMLKKLATLAFELKVHECKPLILETLGNKLPRVFQSMGIDIRSVYMNVGHGVVDIEPSNYQSWIRINVHTDANTSTTILADQNPIVLRIGGISRSFGRPSDHEARALAKGIVYTSKSGERFDGFRLGQFIPEDGSTKHYYFTNVSFPKNIDTVCRIIQAVISETRELPMNPFPDRHGPDHVPGV
jgi:hypothetical protein